MNSIGFRSFVIFFCGLCVGAPSWATLITTGTVTPAGIGPGDITISTAVTIGGDFNAPGSGSLTINNGSRLTANTAPFMNLAPLPGSNGSLTVSGSNGSPSLLRLEGADSSSGAFLTVGRGGVATARIEAGARVDIDSLGANVGRQIPGLPFPAGFQIGRNAGSSGALELTGAGTEMHVTSAFATGAIGAEGTGRMDISDGAVLTFSGINSDLNVSSDRGPFVTGVRGERSGTLNVTNGGRIVGPVFLDVGGSHNGTGALTLKGTGSQVTLLGACTPNCPVGFSFPNQGAFFTLGAAGGDGVAEISAGAKMLIDSSGAAGAINVGFGLGGNAILGGDANGTLRVDGAGSELRVVGNQGGFFVGRDRVGESTLTIANGGQVILDNADDLARGRIGDRDGAKGTVRVEGSPSLLDAGNSLRIGLQGGGDVLKNGKLELAGGTALADLIEVDAGGEIVGNGTLAASTPGKVQVRINPFGLIAPGFSTGQIVINGDLILAGGSMALEANSTTDIDQVLVSGDLVLLDGFIDILVGFTPSPGDVLSFFDFAGALTIDPAFDGFRAFALPGTNVPIGTQLSIDVGGTLFAATTVAAAVPEPETLLMLLLGLAGLGVIRSKRETT